MTFCSDGNTALFESHDGNIDMNNNCDENIDSYTNRDENIDSYTNRDDDYTDEAFTQSMAIWSTLLMLVSFTLQMLELKSY